MTRADAKREIRLQRKAEHDRQTLWFSHPMFEALVDFTSNMFGGPAVLLLTDPDLELEIPRDLPEMFVELRELYRRIQTDVENIYLDLEVKFVILLGIVGYHEGAHAAEISSFCESTIFGASDEHDVIPPATAKNVRRWIQSSNIIVSTFGPSAWTFRTCLAGALGDLLVIFDSPREVQRFMKLKGQKQRYTLADFVQ